MCAKSHHCYTVNLFLQIILGKSVVCLSIFLYLCKRFELSKSDNFWKTFNREVVQNGKLSM